MNAGNITAEVLQQLSYIADDETAMAKALKALKLIVAKKNVTDSTHKSKDELKAELSEALTEVRLHREGKIELKPIEELLNEH